MENMLHQTIVGQQQEDLYRQLGVIEKVYIYGMKNMSFFIPAHRPHDINLDGNTLNNIKGVLDHTTANVTGSHYPTGGVNEEFIRDTGIIKPSDESEVALYTPFDRAETNIRNPLEASLLPRAVFVIVTSYMKNDRTKVTTYLRGYTDRFDPNLRHDFNLLFSDDTMFYIDNVITTETLFNNYGVPIKTVVQDIVTLVNGEFHSQLTNESPVRLATVDKAMFDVLADSNVHTTNAIGDISNTTQLTSVTGSNVSPTKFMTEVLTGYDQAYHSQGEVGSTDDLLKVAYGNLHTPKINVTYSAIPILKVIQDIYATQTIHGFSITPNSISLANLRKIYPNLGTYNTFIEVTEPPEYMTPQVLVQQSLASGLEARVASEIGLKMVDFLARSAMERIHLVIIPTVDEFGNINQNQPFCAILSAKSLAEGLPPVEEQRILEIVKRVAIQELYNPYRYNNMVTTIEVRVDIRGLCFIWVGINYETDILAKGTPTITEGYDQYNNPSNSVNYSIQPHSVAIPLYNTGTILPTLQPNRTSIQFVNIQTGNIDYSFNSIPETLEWCFSNGIIEIPNTIERFKEFIDSQTPVIANTWRVIQRDFTNDLKTVLDTVTPAYSAESNHISELTTIPNTPNSANEDIII